ncbi:MULTISPECIES: DUF3318 domain-containing protein [Leptolyngbya]|jgi:hypothetical protein|uniref:DUF3318 domain-containing protein n=2 Tax=Leptolyngbya boryana TaxID=1184 RepID=A0A1Z4JI33_LEPBY|nr:MULTISPECIES: DUF3318 domain-containing protein [Leptolyngbya]BAY56414.1 hypothetical protein NIES2135_32460 [Leptolyngbya boryana NIES-2135]MBD1859770.1 DUF3318 domain-containing protein [Leptolyngbya sp. FACHB-1624]MBD2366518.1 DUF3318 domain-containing protein [Leptolyngbya sp. FACHB-161]MBD2372697.1 DUF3318 domain-containing protein [Leptolyngbya sp. FACHB-238]MBD2397121.1 DUF3318 domain-containing protein [Leptolyngbya sp. FACHB-239]
MNPELEIRRLLDVMPASGRMFVKLVSKPDQRSFIDTPAPLPWGRDRPVYINFDLWSRLSRSQRDLLILRTVSWSSNIKWFQPTPMLGLTALGAIGLGVELAQQDFVGVAAASGLSAIALFQIWRNNRSSRMELEADEQALKIAQRRGYTETEAARALLSAIEAVAQNEGRMLSFVELLRCQGLRAIGGLSPVGIPDELRSE